jgi:hypothetical protein
MGHFGVHPIDPKDPPKPTEKDAALYQAHLQQTYIGEECDQIKEMLLAKNKAYGSSFSHPLRVFAKGLSNEEQILVRIDDKLSRIARGAAAGEDVVQDLIGYLILLRVTRKHPA